MGLAATVAGCANAPPSKPLASDTVAQSSAWPQTQAIRLTSRDGTQISGWWLPAQGGGAAASANVSAASARPVVVLLHGCGGLYSSARERAGMLSLRHGGMAERLSAQGWHVVMPDSLTARGVRSLCEQRYSERSVHQSHRREDVLGTLQWLARQPWADASRVALLGWSHGGSAILAATDLREAAVRNAALKPVTSVAFYPGCADALKRGYQPSGSLLMLLGEKDDWTDPGPCIELGRRIAAPARVYPDSYHGFDEPTGTVRLRRDVPNGVNPGQGVHVGRNPVTGPQAWADAIAHLRDTFKSF